MAVAAPALAQTCPSTDGVGYTFVDNGTSTSYNVGAGQSLLIQSGTYTGSVEGPAAGASICVNPSAAYQPANVNNMAGTVENHGTTVMNGVNFNGGATLDNQSGGTMTLNNTNANGGITVSNAANAEMFLSGSITIPGGSTITNEGRIEQLDAGSIDLQPTSITSNSGVLQLNGGNAVSAGTFDNTGIVLGMNELQINAGSFSNDCAIVASTRIINGGILVNNGFLVVRDAGEIRNNGQLSQGPGAASAAVDFINDGAVSGTGRYHFTGNTENQGPFNGDSAATPIVFHDTTREPPPEFFDLEDVVPTNTLSVSFDPPDPDQVLADCSSLFPDVPQADVSVLKTASEPSVAPGGEVVYTIEVGNDGPDGAEGTTLTDTPDAELTCSSVTCTEATGDAVCPTAGAGAGELSLANLLGAGVELELPAASTLTFELECTAPGP